MSFLQSSSLPFSLSIPLIAVLGWVIGLPWDCEADLETHADFQLAKSALNDSLYELAVRKLEVLLKPAVGLTDAEKNQVRIFAAEASVRDGKPEAALSFLESPSLAGSSEAGFWRGMALVTAGRLTDAVITLQPFAADPSFAHHLEAVLNHADLLHSLGESSAALEELTAFFKRTDSPEIAVRARIRAAEIETSRGHFDTAAELLHWQPTPDAPPLTPAGGIELKLAKARLALAKNDGEESMQHFLDLLDEENEVPEIVRQRATIGKAKSWGLLGEKDKARDALVQFIESESSSPLLESAFQSLGDLDLLTEPSVLTQSETWAADSSFPLRQVLALYYRGIAQAADDDFENASESFSSILQTYPGHSLFIPAGLRQAELLGRAGKNKDLLELLIQLRKRTRNPKVIAYLDTLDARTRFKEGDLEGAAAKFKDAAGAHPDAESKDAELFNAALVAVVREDLELADSIAEQLAKSPDSGLAADLLLERGLYHAAHSQPDAFEELDEFVRRFPDHKRTADAEIALAELYLNQMPAQPVAAREQLLQAQKRNLTLAQQEKLEYVAVWTEAAAGTSEAAIAKATRFLDHWPRSVRRASVHMLLGETYFHLQDYPNAVTYFERLAVESPDSPLAEPSLFFAAKAASLTLTPESLRRAIEVWAQVVERDGPLAPAARHEQGLLKLSLDEPDDAIAAFDSILNMEHASPELRIAATCDKGQALYLKATRGKLDAANLEAAIKAFQSVETSEEASRAWRYQAAVRRGRCLEMLGELEEALELYYEVVVRGAPNAPLASIPVEEFDWYFRAGISAVNLLEKKEDWEGAVKVAERLGRGGGPRAAEADRIADRLRLRHFIWKKPGQ